MNIQRAYLRLLLPLALGAPFSCASCEEVGLEALDPRLSVEPSPIDVGEVPAGVLGRAPVTVSNLGDGPLGFQSVTLDDTSLFSIDGAVPSALGPGQSAAFAVTVRSSTVGALETELLFQTNDTEQPLQRIRVLAQIVDPPLCDDQNACTVDRFDADLNDCVHTFADGTPCEPADKCIIDAVCSQGVCLGRAKTCSDANPCTSDFCRQIDGTCLFELDEDVCDDGNPCTANSCTPEGCVAEPLPSGVTCDDGDLCTTGDACFSGRCLGSGLADGSVCDDGDSCTVGDTCSQGVCTGSSIIDPAAEGEIVFTYPLTDWIGRAFLHRREVSLGDSQVFYGLDHLNLPASAGLSHVLTAMRACGTPAYEFSYQPPDANVQVSYVRRAIQVDTQDTLRLVVGVRQRPQDGFRPQTTAYVLDSTGAILQSQIQRLGGETGRALLPDGSEVYGVIFPLTEGAPTATQPSIQNLVVVREDTSGNPLWRHERSSDEWAELFGVAGPRVLFYAQGRFGALDFNTGATVWSRVSAATSDEMALSTALNLGIIRTKPTLNGAEGQLIAVEILEGDLVFELPPAPDALYFPRTEPVISAAGTIGVMMQTNASENVPERLEWLELDVDGNQLSRTALPYVFPEQFGLTRHEDYRDDPYPTVADDGVTYVGYGDTFFAINPGGGVRWTLTSTLGEDAFTGTVPLLRDDGVLLINEGSRRILGVKTNGGRMSADGWASFRHDGRRTNYTPATTTEAN